MDVRKLRSIHTQTTGTFWNIKGMSAESALRWCATAKKWEDFSERVAVAAEKVDLSSLSQCKVDEVADILIGGTQWQLVYIKCKLSLQKEVHSRK